MRRQAWSVVSGIALALAVSAILSRAAPPPPLRTLYSGHHFLPPYPNLRDRFGFDSNRSDPLTEYDVARLNAGWYSDWGASLDPAHPDRLTFVQLIRFSAGSDPHDPAQVKVSPSRAAIAEIAAAHPGALWFMSNEPDSLYQGNPIYPDVYAHAYHDFYDYIKGLDPTALIANGGIVQPTPCRIEYLDIVWDTYLQAYGEPMPVDVWNIHAFILREVYNSWGAGTPPGVDPSCGTAYPIRDGDDIDVFRENLIAFRQWMKDKGEQHKPLIISEYGVLWPDWLEDEDGHKFTPQRVSHFMTQTFDLFLTVTDPDIGYPEDDNRLVQAWAWYSLSDDAQYNGYLFHSDSQEISSMGQTYADYTAALTDTQYTDLAVQLWVGLGPLEQVPPTASYDTLTVTLPVTGALANLGKLPASGVVITSPLLHFQETRLVPGRYEGDVPLLPLPGLVITRPGVYEIALIADPAQAIADPRRGNNAVTVTVDILPDLSISPQTWDIRSPGTPSGTLRVTWTVANEGSWPTPPVSGTLHLSGERGSLLLPDQRFPVPGLGPGAQATLAQELALPGSKEDLYRLALEVDSDGSLDEQDEGNNQATTTIPVVVTATLQASTVSTLTSTSERLTFVFPAETVTTATEIRLTPWAMWDLPPAPLLYMGAFMLEAYRDGQPISLTPALPVSLTWQYTDTHAANLDEERLGLYRLAEDGRWQRVRCPTERRQSEVNRLDTCVQQLGQYVLGQGYEVYVPLVQMDGAGNGSQAQSQGPPSAPGVLPGTPLRLPPWATPPPAKDHLH